SRRPGHATGSADDDGHVQGEGICGNLFSRMNTIHKLLLAVMALFLLVPVCGCGGKGSGSISTGPFKGGIVPVRINQEGANNRDALFAFVGGDGVSGGWVENAQGNKILDSDLRWDNLNARYEITFFGSSGSFAQGNYTLKYTQGGETKALLVENLSWTLLTNFPPTPRLEYDGRDATIYFNQLTGSDVKYYIRLVDMASNYVIYQGIPTSYSAVIRESLSPRTGRWEIHLIGDSYENGVMKSRNIQVFPDVFG
ncbi:MAG TPA: hypothetical protein PKM25_10690, partial [Candidatus Ozemobacteraceae bacterium]|nr:hypothetical protein [Candidatus Ozemobacteraceae bacterium]